MLEMLLLFSALMFVLFIGLYFLEEHPNRKKGLIQRIGELLLFSYYKGCGILLYGFKYIKIKVESAFCNYGSSIEDSTQRTRRLHLTEQQRHVNSSENLYHRHYDYNLKILK